MTGVKKVSKTKLRQVVPCDNCDGDGQNCRTCLCKGCAKFYGCKGTTRCRGPY
jgi:hypothetical protein